MSVKALLLPLALALLFWAIIWSIGYQISGHEIAGGWRAVGGVMGASVLGMIVVIWSDRK